MLKGYGRAFSRPYPRRHALWQRAPSVSPRPRIFVAVRLALTQRRLEANRRNATRSTGPRTAEGKARVARNRHQAWILRRAGAMDSDAASRLRGDARGTPRGFQAAEHDGRKLRPDASRNPTCGWRRCCATRISRPSKHHQQLRARAGGAHRGGGCARSRTASSRSATNLRRAGLWRPTIPGPREAKAIIRYEGRLDRTIRAGSLRAGALKSAADGRRSSSARKCKNKPTSRASPGSGPEARRRTSNGDISRWRSAKTNPLRGIAEKCPEARRRTSNGTFGSSQKTQKQTH